MGLSTLSGHRVTHARVTLPAWGCWYADVSVDGDVTLTGSVELKIADLTLRGTVLSGGPYQGRSHFRIVAGAGGWGRVLPRKAEASDLGVRLATAIRPTAEAVGETVDLDGRDNELIGPSFVRPEGPAFQVLQLLADRAWYVDEAGTTRLGRRPRTTFAAKATTVSLDRSSATVTLASEAIAPLLPGVVVEQLEAVDVEHELTPEGLRTTIWGQLGSSSSRRVDAWRKIVAAVDPARRFRGLYEYRVVTREGKRLNLQPVRVSTGMPPLRRARVMPGVAGCDAEVALGARVLVAFVDESPTRPIVVAFEDAEGEGFVPSALNLRAGGMVGGEHVMTVEGCVVLLHNLLFGLSTLGLPAAWAASGVINGVINAALAASAVPAPLGAVAQAAAAPGIASAMLTGPGNSVLPYVAGIAALDGKVANDSGLFPSFGSKAVEAG